MAGHAPWSSGAAAASSASSPAASILACRTDSSN